MYQDNKRASQFMPFNGLRGYDTLIKEAETPKVYRKEMTEEHANRLNQIIQSIKRGDIVKITYYTVKGYIIETCKVQEINGFLHYIRTDKNCLSFRDIWDIQV